ncbi:sigma-70 family RNA polymerase sigma factor [Paenibacillus glucanolyticus]|jgi:RNA polymerase sigma factor (sigma-70 family)|uniref:RNA polymerase subunit sigma-24 n=1 Tax=Paenibacillus glucanolyticus TaxID=59843 RepID=A0A163KBF9_9BACL|nr:MULTISPECIES: sigma-70 family RNA polymerase sigma factor [Paenibacillus]ANA81080.1 hypothetical protein A3958_14345 [Paenibacillus glucanolyticus]AVV54801.1 sigma-70 family RNA polymerase sigma factor [Paenibacillus glucanolyticus]ETT36351.1 RNA polymerase sigma factor rpoD Sigma-43 [Paenibacillus sp. FSL R5-808]KZS47116.1 hypothetical protein AWU65_14875 [Paenibacillus glucanolyticus]MDH6672701.1 RNA polymerase sigma factor (sigma-70 family) [Paenibacillus sp. LBL]
MDNFTDEKKLILEIMNGEIDKFSIIIDQYQNRIFSYFIKMGMNYSDAQELTQETFFKAYTKLDQHNLSKKFSTWLFSIAINLMRDFQRKQKWMLKLPFAVNENVADYRTPESEFIYEDQKKSIMNLLNVLPMKKKQILILRYLGELSYQEIADILQISSMKVRNELFSAKKKLRSTIQEKGDDLNEMLRNFGD